MDNANEFLRLPLNRPEYVAAPEAFITALAWKLFDVENGDQSERRAGLYFRGSHNATSEVAYRATAPEGDRLRALSLALRENGLRVEDNDVQLAEAALGSVLGIRVERSGVQTVSPISPSFALMQNTRGILRKQNPADIAEILERMYAFGSPSAPGEPGVADRWLLAANHRLAVDPLLSALDDSFDAALIRRSPRTDKGPANSDPSSTFGRFTNTPFEWFAESWNALTRDDWVQALPARVWVDWATTLLRLAYGFGFLWECSWYISVAREVQKPTASNWDDLRAGIEVTVPWVSARAGTAARDIAPKLSRRVYKSEIIRHAIDKWLLANKVDAANFDILISRMQGDTVLKDELLAALNSNDKPKSGSNLWEAVKYALATRDASGSNPDYYGLLQSRGRYTTVSPGTEWIAVVASLACNKPGGQTDVGRVLSSLEKLGMQPELADLIALLERAGMARGSADADRGVVVQSAF